MNRIWFLCPWQWLFTKLNYVISLLLNANIFFFFLFGSRTHMLEAHLSHVRKRKNTHQSWVKDETYSNFFQFNLKGKICSRRVCVRAKSWNLWTFENYKLSIVTFQSWSALNSDTHLCALFVIYSRMLSLAYERGATKVKALFRVEMTMLILNLMIYNLTGIFSAINFS